MCLKQAFGASTPSQHNEAARLHRLDLPPVSTVDPTTVPPRLLQFCGGTFGVQLQCFSQLLPQLASQTTPCEADSTAKHRVTGRVLTN